MQQPQDWTKTDHYYIALSIAQQFRLHKPEIFAYKDDALMHFGGATVIINNKGIIRVFPSSEVGRSPKIGEVTILVINPDAIKLTVTAIKKIRWTSWKGELNLLKNATFSVSWIIIIHWIVQDSDKIIPWIMSIIKGI